jgi:hypothetical protein
MYHTNQTAPLESRVLIWLGLAAFATSALAGWHNPGLVTIDD